MQKPYNNSWNLTITYNYVEPFIKPYGNEYLCHVVHAMECILGTSKVVDVGMTIAELARVAGQHTPADLELCTQTARAVGTIAREWLRETAHVIPKPFVG